MKKIVITGMGKEKAAKLGQSIAGEQLEISTTSDYEGILAIKNGQVDYYIGICQSGMGGALALAIGLLGSSRCATVSMIGKPPNPHDIEDAVREEKVAFGFANDHIEQVMPHLVRAILDHS